MKKTGNIININKLVLIVHQKRSDEVDLCEIITWGHHYLTFVSQQASILGSH